MDLIFFIFSDGIFIVLKENLGRSPGPNAVIDEHYMSSKRCMFQQKDDHRESRKQNSASITLHQHTTSYTATEHREVVGNFAFPLLVAALSSFNVEKLYAVNSSFLFSFSL